MTICFIQDESGAVHIGSTAGSPAGHLACLQAACSGALNLLASIHGGRGEAFALRKRFAELGIRGGWHRAEPRLLGFIEGLLYLGAPTSTGDDGPQEDGYDLDADLVDTVRHVALLTALRRDAEAVMGLLQAAIRAHARLTATELDRVQRVREELDAWVLGWDELLTEAVADRVFPLGDVIGTRDSLAEAIARLEASSTQIGQGLN